MAKKLPLTELQRAAILAGAVEIEVDAEGQGEQTNAGAQGGNPTEGDEGTGAPAAGATSTEPTQEEAAATAAAATAAAAGAASKDSELVAFLRGELQASNDKVVAAQVEIAQLKAQASAGADTLPKLLDISREIVGNMQVALGTTNTTAAMDAPAVIAEHARLTPLFKAKFKVGGVAASSSQEEKPTNVVPISPDFQARLNSIQRATR